MNPFPRELLARPRPRDTSEQVRPRWQENARVLGPMAALLAVALLAMYAPLAGPMAVWGRLGAMVLAVVLLQVLARRLRRRGGWPPELEEAGGLYRAGDLGAARARLEGVLADEALHPAFRSVALAWWGMLALRGGAPDAAQDLWAEVARSGHWRERGLRFALAGVPGLAALAAAVEGDLGRARRWLDDAPRLGAELGDGTRLLAEAFLAARTGGDRTAILERWALAEGTLSPAELRALRVLCAYGAPSPAVAERLLAGARPGWPGELDYLAAHWPELALFLQTHGFSPPGPRHG